MKVKQYLIYVFILNGKENLDEIDTAEWKLNSTISHMMKEKIFKM